MSTMDPVASILSNAISDWASSSSANCKPAATVLDISAESCVGRFVELREQGREAEGVAGAVMLLARLPCGPPMGVLGGLAKDMEDLDGLGMAPATGLPVREKREPRFDDWRSNSAATSSSRSLASSSQVFSGSSGTSMVTPSSLRSSVSSTEPRRRLVLLSMRDQASLIAARNSAAKSSRSFIQPELELKGITPGSTSSSPSCPSALPPACCASWPANIRALLLRLLRPVPSSS
mmetsp:Transcript_55226/g.161153  ORF Transcript_55226/g.161153 Transcript_55226/m.161153 type:complete len:235 (-) Transcript_55226:913-1617(-)